jgi:hypothetical protein
MRKRNLNKELLIVAILLISTAPLYAQRQQSMRSVSSRTLAS